MRLKKGFSLIEILLVMVVISVFLLLTVQYMQQSSLNLRIDRTASQIQQVLNAGLSYYVNEGKWPDKISTLQSNNYLPPALIGPFGNDYTVVPYNVANNVTILTVTTVIPATSPNANAIAKTIAGKLPLSYSSANFISAGVNMPGQDLNNATAVNYAGLYHHGGCIPVPHCPLAPPNKWNTTQKLMVPRVIVVPVSVSGLAQNGNLTNVYPLSSFTAYVTGGSDDNPGSCQNTTVSTGSCRGSDPAEQTKYWRACINITTQYGKVNGVNTASWGQYVTLAAFTRCEIPNEPQGSDFSVYGN